MTDKELIKQEIERLKEHTAKCGYLGQGEFENGNREGRNWVCDKLLSFIDSLPEEPASDDLEEELDNYIKDNFFGSGSMGFFSNRTKQELNSIDVANIAHHFAEWQKQKDQETIELAEDHAMLAGMMKEREEIMKDAVIAWVNTYESVTNPYDNEVSFITNLSPSKFKNKEMVKIIIIKEE